MELRKIEGDFAERVETGPVQFGDDWPGVFIRGDNAGYLSMVLDHILAAHGDKLHPIMERGTLESLRDTLGSCDMRKLRAGE